MLPYTLTQLIQAEQFLDHRFDALKQLPSRFTDSHTGRLNLQQALGFQKFDLTTQNTFCHIK
ncbi:hypothetical protein D3C71_2099120 [compost metagenome]